MAVLVPALNADSIERTIMTSPSLLNPKNIFCGSFSKVKHFKGGIKSKSKFHISINHINVMGELHLVATLKDNNTDFNHALFNKINSKRTEEIEFEKLQFDLGMKFEYIEEVSENNVIKFTKGEKTLNEFKEEGRSIILIVKLAKPVFIRTNSFFIGSRMDFHEESKNCRIAFYGHSELTL